MKKIVHVAVGVIFDCGPTDDGNILIAKRADHQHQGGLWEFPGGKVEEGESASQALQRELEEELGLQCELEDMTPLISIPFHYPDKSVLLDVWAVHNVIRFDKRIGKENQPLRWVEKADLKAYDFPAANKAIINALLLPKQIAISQDHSDADVILAQVATTLKNHHNVWLQLRAPSLDQLQYTQLAMKLYGICHEAGSKLIWNCPLDWYQVAFADGLHLSRKNYADAKTHSNNIGQRPIPEHQWLSMACHNLAELEVAHDMADYVLVSPVKETSTHRQATPLTWSGFNVISQQARIPCYALGGMNISDITSAVQQGGQGIAAIRCFVDEPAAADENNAMKGKCYES